MVATERNVFSYADIAIFDHSHPTMTSDDIARTLVDSLDEATIRTLARDFVRTSVDDMRRARARRIEEESEREAVMPNRQALRQVQQQVRVQRKAGREEREWEGESRLVTKLSQIIAEHDACVRLEVTAELLDTVFALGDGTRVTWGDATIGQHRQRADALSVMAAGTLETAARHQAAISMIQEAGATCLRQLTAIAA